MDIQVVEIPGGCVLMARKLQEDDVWFSKPSWWFKVWCYLIMEVNHAGVSGFEKGEGFFDRKKIYNDCHLGLDRVKVKSVDNVIQWLKATNMITTKKTTRGVRIKINKYEFFQSIDNYRAKGGGATNVATKLKTEEKTQIVDDNHNNGKDTEKDTEKTQERHRKDTINKNDNNEKNEKKEETTTFAPQETSPKPQLHPVVKVVLAYKIKKGFQKDDKAWDKINFARCTKSARQMIEYFASWEEAINCIDHIGTEMDKKGLSWTLETCVKWASDFKQKREREVSRDTA
jgi:hypothetical protein